MATAPQHDRLNIEEQLARIAKMRRDHEKTSVEIQRTSVEIQKLVQDIKLATPQMFFQGGVAAAALIGATAVITKVLFP